jgi:hypothetical protein
MARIHSKKFRAAEKAKAEAAAWRRYLEEIHKEKCSECGAKNTAYILYGLPNFDEQLKQDCDNGLIVLGGCDIIAGNPNFECNECRHSWS